MRHRGQIGDDRFAGDVLAQDHRQAALVVDEGGRIGQLLVTDHLAVGIGQFDADHRAARNGRNARADRAHVARDILGQADHAAGLDARRRLELVHGHHRTGADRSDLALHVEVVEHVLKQPRIAFERHLVELGRGVVGRVVEQVLTRQLVIGEHVALLRRGRLGLGGGGRRVGDFGRAARFANRQVGVFGRVCGGGGALLFLGRQRQVEFGELRLALDEFGQCQELRPVEREHPGDQRDAAAQRSQRQRQHDPAGKTAAEAFGNRFDPEAAQLPEQTAGSCGQAAATRFEHQRQHRAEQGDCGQQHGQRSPPATGRLVLVVALDAAPQPARCDIEQWQQQDRGQTEEIERAFAGPGPAGAHPIADVGIARGSRWAGIGLGVAGQRQRQEDQQYEQQSCARHVRGAAEAAAKCRAPVWCCACARGHRCSPDP